MYKAKYIRLTYMKCCGNRNLHISDIGFAKYSAVEPQFSNHKFCVVTFLRRINHCTVVIFLNRTHQLMDNFVEMNGNSNKTSHNKVINTKEKNIHEN